MISAGDRDEIKGLGLGLGLGLGSRRREMVEFELEEGEAFSYQNREQDFDTTVDPDIALSYIVSLFLLPLMCSICFILLFTSFNIVLFYFLRSMT